MPSAGIIAILFATLFWGLSFISIKVAVVSVPPMTLALLRFIVASLLLYPWLRWQEPSVRLTRAHCLPLALTGFIGVTLYFFFQNTGIQYTSASEASLIVAAVPLLTLLGDALFCKARIILPQIAGILLSLPGVYLLLDPSAAPAGNWLGNLYMAGAALCWVAYCLATRPLGRHYSQLAIVTYQTLFGTLALLPLSLLEAAQWQPLSPIVLLHIAYLGIFCSALGYYLYVYAMERLGVSAVSLFVNLIPLVSASGAFLLLDETLRPLQLAGGALILAAVVLVSRKQPPKLSIDKAGSA